MPVSSAISCCQQLRPPGPPPAPREEGSSSSSRIPLSRRRACFLAAAAACVVAVAAGGAGEAAAMARGAPHEHEAAAAVRVQAGAAARWSERRQCPPWRANSLENVVPENLPRPSARRRYNGVGERDPAPAPAASPEAVLPFLALRSGGMGCFSL
ncbi:uncharacterized protein LOC100843339 [Brachypodium distachyon]|nr:uncharacterized protein LOC100843339 [Brachypodium distachyon]|eukprot:XP_010230998.1 uncharacterized protein LOC100843339 [Brachypodium distachyon]